MLDTRQVGGESLGAVTAGALAGDDVTVRQFSFRELTYRRFMSHPTAKWALLALGILIVACYGAPLWHLLFPNYIQAPDQFSLLDAGTGPSLKHLFGTDSYNGHDIFSLVLYGGRFSIFIGIGSMVIAAIIGVTWGATAGYFGHALDALLMRITDVFLTIPALLLVPLAARVFGEASPWKIALIFGLLSWPSISRIVRSQFLSLREMQFAEAARALGVPNRRIIFRHLLPNAVGPIVVAFTLGIANNIVLEAFVSFLGFGIQPPNYSWGSTLAGAQGVLVQGNWWWITFPGLAVVVTVLCINFIGDGLRDALDPKIIR
ncbi:MAG TPA: ABC transporter permease [Candidatus Dormibacteraeota bacterium]|jgi:peptide/nickel transport system permease protein|nr:ABC transporter permease [Candidatus Dormibacteraeota bacterium]